MSKRATVIMFLAWVFISPIAALIALMVWGLE